jgi:glutathionylspermidine synthase
MRRVAIKPRANLAARAKELGFDFVASDGEIYWDESAYYVFTLAEIENDIEAPTQELAALCLDLLDRIVRDERSLQRLKIPRLAWDLIAESWRRKDPTLYGRFDFAYCGQGPAKLLEYNADTPTTLYEAAVFQWIWLEDAMAQGLLPKDADQFNSLHEKLVARLAKVAERRPLHMAYMANSVEDRGFIAYLEDCARQAGLSAYPLRLEDIGLRRGGAFLDLSNRPIELLFKLYPWEFMLKDAFGQAPAMHQTRFLEPPWKMLLSNKGILPLLWEAAPRHPNILPAFFEGDPGAAALNGRYARKPLYSREGANVALVDGARVIDRDNGPYGAEGFVLQALVEPAVFDHRYPILGSWLIGDEACGMGVREDKSPITKNNARFLPHAIID